MGRLGSVGKWMSRAWNVCVMNVPVCKQEVLRSVYFTSRMQAQWETRKQQALNTTKARSHVLQRCQKYQTRIQDPGKQTSEVGLHFRASRRITHWGFSCPVSLTDVPSCGDCLIWRLLVSMSLQIFRVQQIDPFPYMWRQKSKVAFSYLWD